MMDSLEIIASGDLEFGLLRSSSDDRILWIRSGIEFMWLIEQVANGGQLLT